MEFPINPIQGQEYTVSNKVWVFNGKGWALKSTTVSYSNLDEKPSINSVELVGNKTAIELGLALENHTHDYESANANIQTHISSNTNPHSVNKAQVGLGNVDNTSDASKPISNATQTALNNKVDKVTGSSLVPDAEIAKLAEYPELPTTPEDKVLFDDGTFKTLPTSGGSAGTVIASNVTETTDGNVQAAIDGLRSSVLAIPKFKELVISKSTFNSIAEPGIYINNATAKNITGHRLTTNATDFSITVAGTTYTNTATYPIALPANAELIINDVTIQTGYNVGNVILIIE